jgi:hypothetical protein
MTGLVGEQLHEPGTCFCLNKGIEWVAKLEHANV